MSKMHTSVMFMGVLLLAACSSQLFAQGSPNRQQRQQAYNAAAGAPVRNFRLQREAQVYSWEALSESQLVVYTMSNRAYLLDVGSCSPLMTTTSISLSNSNGVVQTKLDKVLTRRPNIPCAIQQIRPIDLAKYKADRNQPQPTSNVPAGNGAMPTPSGS